MSLENGKCPCCGGALALDASKEKAVCRYCGNELIIWQALQKFKIDGIEDFGALLLGAQRAMEDGDFDKAMEKYKKALDLKPDDYRALWGMYTCEMQAIEWAYRRKGFVQYPGDVKNCVDSAVGKYARRAYDNAPEETRQYYADEIERAEAAFRLVVTERKRGCFIATSVYGSYDCPEVWVLRRYRDRTLSGHAVGRLFIKCYYALSPLLIRLFGKRECFKRFWRRILDRKVSRLKSKGLSDSPYDD